ncbi:UDP:flavonoid glycosyltransferase YjiC, YdhE family [Friedmanniella luteola]|uniref:UDP:flavonoid glycosyltransferase YjiC, YdhE family n=1 Tax=Friedmanniella luteola TaxID=546871 RepID=A0A1H1XGV3_9ACTN|nr:glycosyltransferase [Friedmanniella luteola]SDT08458.1 UDP:flavonoid glycosyltransferase YjiC, YdhE family [Friedmanniella luteola]
MSHFLLPATPIYGHVTPMVAIGRGLVERGHRVTVLTGRKYAATVRGAGLGFRPLPAEADYDDAQLDSWLPGRQRLRGVAAGRHDILGLFVGPLPAQHRALESALRADRYDAVVCEAAFLGALPLLSVPAEQRLPVVGVSVTPLALSSADCAPFGAGLQPDTTVHGLGRNWIISTVLHRGPLRPVQAGLRAALRAVDAPEPEGNYFDQATRYDLTFQLATPGIEYPRRSMPSTVRFVGPLQLPVVPGAAQDQPRPAGRRTDAPGQPDVPGRTRGLPSWWGDLDGRRAVVHVTQGTMANGDLSRLMVPTLRGLARDDVLVVASTGGRPVEQLVEQHGGPLPDNVRVASFLPYDQLLPRTSVMVTNGGFGGVQQALAYGVPLVVAGSTEDKPEVAARVAWSGTGLNLRTGSPGARRVRRAVRRVLGSPGYRREAARLQREIAELGDPVATVTDVLTRLTEGSASDRLDRVGAGRGRDSCAEE